jgi:hypothetical protein
MSLVAKMTEQRGLIMKTVFSGNYRRSAEKIADILMFVLTRNSAVSFLRKC